MDQSTEIVHYLSPTQVLIALAVGLVIDYIGVGPRAWADRIAWGFYAVAFREGFAGSSFTNATVGKVQEFIDAGLSQTGDAYVRAANANYLVGGLVGIIVIYSLFALMPTKFQRVFGTAATMGFHSPFRRGGGGSMPVGMSNSRLNPWIIGSAVLVGLFCYLPGGLIGTITETGLRVACLWAEWVITFVFGRMG